MNKYTVERTRELKEQLFWIDIAQTILISMSVGLTVFTASNTGDWTSIFILGLMMSATYLSGRFGAIKACITFFGQENNNER